MIMSPTQLSKPGANFSNKTLGLTPFTYARRKEGAQIVLKKAPEDSHAAKVKLDRLVFRIIEESSARAANLRSGDVNVAERLAPTELGAIRNDSNLQLLDRTSLGYQGITINIGNK